MVDLTGQIGIVPHPHTFVEHAIDWVTKSPVHHAVLAISPTKCVSCESGGARLRNISDFPDAYWSAFDLTTVERDTIVAFGNSKLGKPYGWFADAAIAIALVSGIQTPLWIQSYLNSDRRYECAQLCDAAYNAAGRHMFVGIISSAVFPGMFIPIWKSNGWPE